MNFIIGLEIIPSSYQRDGLIFYFGPMRYSSNLGVQDFMSLQLINGNPVLYVDYGQGTIVIDESNQGNNVENTKFDLIDDKPHKIDIYWTRTVILIT